MGKNKIKRFADNKKFENVIQPSREDLQNGLEIKGKWRKNVFKNDHPIVLELGCGKGEYSVGLAQAFPEKNFIGVDIKGARIWVGAKQALEKEMKNVAFLRMQIQDIDKAFANDEVDEIWVTFPDPQLKFRRKKLRLTHPNFLKKYSLILRENGLVHLKTDSEFLFGYTQGVLEGLELPIKIAQHDVYGNLPENIPSYVSSIQTHYEGIFSAEGKKITYMQFSLDSMRK